jgi:phosphoribosyl 1,2-cyclic phosphodiesterase
VEIFFWGTRGSIPCPGAHTVRYGGNTTCVEIRAGSQRIFIDAGTGIRNAGSHILANDGPSGNDIQLLMTHTHWDHIQGFPFFVPIFIPGNKIHIRGPHMPLESFADVIRGQMQYSYFPVKYGELGAVLTTETLREESFMIGDVKVTPKYVNHPVVTLAYRFDHDGKSICFMTDIEPYRDVIYNGVCPSDEEQEEFEEIQALVASQNQRLVDFVEESDVLVMDAQYTHEEYLDGKVGWGHTSMEDAIRIAQKARAKHLVFAHHDPERTDDQLDRLVGHHREVLGAEKGCTIEELSATIEGSSITA